MNLSSTSPRSFSRFGALALLAVGALLQAGGPARAQELNDVQLRMLEAQMQQLKAELAQKQAEVQRVTAMMKEVEAQKEKQRREAEEQRAAVVSKIDRLIVSRAVAGQNLTARKVTRPGMGEPQYILEKDGETVELPADVIVAERNGKLIIEVTLSSAR